MLQTLHKLDIRWLLYINGHHNEFLDRMMWLASARFSWIPLYALIGYLIVCKFRWKSWLPVLLAVLAVVLSDQVASHLIKEAVHRLRPSHNPELMSSLHYVNGYTGGLYGFVSSHAANTSAFTFFMVSILRKWYIPWILIPWFLLVSYSRIYLGVHYPSDVLGGWVVGLITGMFCYWIYRKIGGQIGIGSVKSGPITKPHKRY